MCAPNIRRCLPWDTNGKGHGCILITIGTGMVYVRSFKLKLVTLSSTESEWVVLCEATMLAEWTKNMLYRLGIIVQPILIRQDNTSAIWLSENGPNFARTKHLLIKRNFAKQGVLNGICEIKYTPTEAMCADMGTKPLSYRQLMIHLKKMGFMIPIVNGNIYRVIDIVIPAIRIAHRVKNNISNSNVPSQKNIVITSIKQK